MAKIGKNDGDPPLKAAGTLLTDAEGRIAEIIPVGETESATEPEPADESPWHLMDDAPQNRPIYLTEDPDRHSGLLCQWRTTRIKNKAPQRGWSPRSFWAALLTKREIDFEPAFWREAMAPEAAALREVA